jgi:hypothetical protein
VGLTATGALTHYDTKARKVVPLYANVEELEAAERVLVEERERLSNGLKEIEVRLRELGRKEREARAQLLADAAARRKELTAVADKEKLLAAYYGKPGAKTRAKSGERFFAEYAALERLARLRRAPVRPARPGRVEGVSGAHAQPRPARDARAHRRAGHDLRVEVRAASAHHLARQDGRVPAAPA